MDQDDRLDQELASLARRTEPVRPRRGFDERVLLAVAADGPAGFPRGLLGAARRLLPALALAAAVSVVWAAVSERSANAALAVADDPVELAW